MPRRVPAEIKLVKTLDDDRLKEFREIVERGHSVASKLKDGTTIGVFAITELAEYSLALPKRVRSVQTREHPSETK